jgi:thiol-disulfide isomerase/thioredoxin
MNESDTERPAPGEARKPSRRRLRGLWINVAIVLVVFFGIQWFKSRPLASGMAPPLAARTVAGETVDLAALRGEPVLVHFWATWCPTCKLVEGSIDSLEGDYQVITIAMQSGGEREVAAYLRERGLGFDAIADPYGEIATEWGVPGVPATFVLDGEGEIHSRNVGYTPGVGLRGMLWAAGAE